MDLAKTDLEKHVGPKQINQISVEQIIKAVSKEMSIKEKNILRRAGSDAYQSMIALFQRQRVDLLITYPTVFKEYATGQNDNIGAVSIAKHPLFIAGHIACSNTAYSQEIIKQINRA